MVSYWKVHYLINGWMHLGLLERDKFLGPAALIIKVFEVQDMSPLTVEDVSWLFGPHGLTLLKAKIARMEDAA